jgi:hypothetical protein
MLTLSLPKGETSGSARINGEPVEFKLDCDARTLDYQVKNEPTWKHFHIRQILENDELDTYYCTEAPQEDIVLITGAMANCCLPVDSATTVQIAESDEPLFESAGYKRTVKTIADCLGAPEGEINRAIQYLPGHIMDDPEIDLATIVKAVGKEMTVSAITKNTKKTRREVERVCDELGYWSVQSREQAERLMKQVLRRLILG